ncbi:MAG: hypothetical protein RL664_887 [Bacteroidota bacterium]|jgi:hypothetical protein
MNKLFFLSLFTALTTSVFAQGFNCYSLNMPGACTWAVYNGNGETLAQGVSPEATSFCVPDGCFQISVESMAMNPLPITVELYDSSSNLVNVENQGNEFYYIAFLSVNGITGCSDPYACNFNPDATCFDYLSCEYSCQGCTNPDAFNFNPNATVDNGTCCTEHWATFNVEQGQAGIWLYSEQYYMTGGDNLVNSQFCVRNSCYALQVYSFDEASVNQNFTVTLEDGSVWLSGVVDSNYLYTTVSLNPVYGCADPNACNYNPGTTCNDGSCDYASCSGCTDPLATNYNPDATSDNGKCCYGDIANITTSVPSTWTIQSSTGYYQYGNTPADSTVCIYSGCYTWNSYPIAFDPFNPDGESTFVTITDSTGYIVSQGVENSFETGLPYTFLWGVVVPGCTEPSACNYNPLATCNELAYCDYSCQGCTDPAANNYDSNATVDNGACCFNNWYTVESSAWIEWYVTSSDGLDQQGGYNNMLQGFCMDQDCFSFNAWSLTVQPFDLTIYGPDGSIFYQTTSNVNPYINEYFTSNEIVGCTDLFACNYNPNATCANYNLCDYSCQGCTDPSAPNYDADATVDNGTCCAAANWNTVSSEGQVIFYAFNPNTGEGEFNEYPYSTGYCMNAADCYQLVLYSFVPDSSEVTVSNGQGEIVFSGNLANFAYYQQLVSGINEVAGCTEPTACNYNSNATCDVGSCIYYCGGCLDPTAVNFNEYSQFDDGSCVYTSELPNMGLMLVQDSANDQFYVMMELAEMGTGGPYGVASSANEPMMVMNTTGQALKGPYSCGTEVQYTVHDMGNNMQTAMTSPVYTMACSVRVEETPAKKTDVQLFPNPATNNVQLTGIEKGTSVEVYDLTGRILFKDKAQSDRMEISVAKWNAGVYLVRAAGKTMRLVKE